MKVDRKEIGEILFDEFGIDSMLTSFGENERNNVFLATSEKSAFIVKLEEASRLEQVTLSIQAAEYLLASDALCSSRYIKAKSGAYVVRSNDTLITVQVKENLTPISPRTDWDYIYLGEAIGEFHLLMQKSRFEDISESDFYLDFMYNEIPLAQTPERLAQIKEFYSRCAPDVTRLSTGVVHNDLNLGNISLVGEKYFFLDFEHLKKGPLVSDLGVFALELWDDEKGVQDYTVKLHKLLCGYERKIKLSSYDKAIIPVYSMRYLYSDENLYHYWSVNGTPNAAKQLPGIRRKQKLLLAYLSEIPAKSE